MTPTGSLLAMIIRTEERTGLGGWLAGAWPLATVIGLVLAVIAFLDRYGARLLQEWRRSRQVATADTAKDGSEGAGGVETAGGGAHDENDEDGGERAAVLTDRVLPERVLLSDLPTASSTGDVDRAGRLAAVAYGLTDVLDRTPAEGSPGEKDLPAASLDLVTDGHLFVTGSSGSGRSQVLRTVAGALATKHSVADVHLYGIDADGGALAALSWLPHCGGVVGVDDLERLERLLLRLDTELTLRRATLADRGRATLTELREVLPPDERPAHVVLLLDGLDAVHPLLSDHDNGRLADVLHRVLREGPPAGMHVLLTAERITGEAPYVDATENRLLLRRDDLGGLAGLGASGAGGGLPDQGALLGQGGPERTPPGRAWHQARHGHIQVALLAADGSDVLTDGADPRESEPTAGGSDSAQGEELRRIGQAATERCRPVVAEQRPFTVAPLPRSVPFTEVYPTLPEPHRRPMWALLGVGGDAMGPVGLDLGDPAEAVLVVGPPGSGRSNTLATMAVSLLAGGTSLVVLAPRDSPLRRLATHQNVTVITDLDPAEDELTRALAALPEKAGVLLVDDADAYAPEFAAGTVLRDLVTGGANRGIGVVLAGTATAFLQPAAGWLTEAARFHRGVLLAPQTTVEGDLLGQKLPLSTIRRGGEPGNTYVVDPTTRNLTVLTVAHTPLK